MKVHRVKIHNFRSIRDVEFRGEPLLVFIGPNNHGKSNILAALQFFFDAGAKGSLSDFFSEASTDSSLEVEVEFSELSEQEQKTFEKYVLPGNRMIVRKRVSRHNGTLTVEYHGVIEVPNVEWLQHDKAGEYTSRDRVSGIDEKYGVLRYFPPSGRISKDCVLGFQQKYIEEHRAKLKFIRREEEAPFMGAKTVAAGLLGDFVMVPAVRDLSEEARVQQAASFGKLLSHTVDEMSRADAQFVKLKADLAQLVDRLRRGGKQRPEGLQRLEDELLGELRAWGVEGLEIQVRPPDVEKILQMGATLLVNDGVLTAPEAKGHGLQRVMLFSLLKAWTLTQRTTRVSEDEALKSRASSDLLILAFEEPELFLHPQGQRQIFETLRAFTAVPVHQVFLCTHSSAFVDADNCQQICVVRRPSISKGTCVSQGPPTIFKGSDAAERKRRFNLAYWLNPDRSELFFAQKVVLVEGQAEKAVLSWVGQQEGVFRHDVSIVDCGGKFNIRPYIDLCNAFEMSYLIVHDKDPLTGSSKDDEKRKRLFAENTKIKSAISSKGEIKVVDPDFESVCGISRTAGKKVGKPLAIIEKFQADAKIPEKVVELAKIVFA